MHGGAKTGVGQERKLACDLQGQPVLGQGKRWGADADSDLARAKADHLPVGIAPEGTLQLCQRARSGASRLDFAGEQLTRLFAMEPGVGQEVWQASWIGEKQIRQVRTACEHGCQQGRAHAVLGQLDLGLAQAFETHACRLGIGASRKTLIQGLHGRKA